jgi:hypothetical protein
MTALLLVCAAESDLLSDSNCLRILRWPKSRHRTISFALKKAGGLCGCGFIDCSLNVIALRACKRLQFEPGAFWLYAKKPHRCSAVGTVRPLNRIRMRRSRPISCHYDPLSGRQEHDALSHRRLTTYAVDDENLSAPLAGSRAAKDMFAGSWPFIRLYRPKGTSRRGERGHAVQIVSFEISNLRSDEIMSAMIVRFWGSKDIRHRLRMSRGGLLFMTLCLIGHLAPVVGSLAKHPFSFRVFGLIGQLVALDGASSKLVRLAHSSARLCPS